MIQLYFILPVFIQYQNGLRSCLSAIPPKITMKIILFRVQTSIYVDAMNYLWTPSAPFLPISRQSSLIFQKVAPL